MVADVYNVQELGLSPARYWQNQTSIGQSSSGHTLQHVYRLISPVNLRFGKQFVSTSFNMFKEMSVSITDALFINVPKAGQNEPNAPSIGPVLAQFCHGYRAVVGGFSAQMALYAEMALMVFPHHVCF